jgi:hypothetical protein
MSGSGWENAGPQGGASGAGPPPGGGYSLTAVASNPDYPVTAGLDAPLEVARWRVIGNYILAIPHLVVLYVLQIVANVFVFVAWIMILFTGAMPPGIGNFVAGVHRYQWRVLTYVLFLREQYPAFGVPSGYAEPGGDPAWLQIAPPQTYNRLAVLLRFILIIPQAVFGVVLAIALFFAAIAAFFAVLITGGWPVGLRKFVLDVYFWATRVNAWYALLADRYPPFTLG